MLEASAPQLEQGASRWCTFFVHTARGATALLHPTACCSAMQGPQGREGKGGGRAAPGLHGHVVLYHMQYTAVSIHTHTHTHSVRHMPRACVLRGQHAPCSRPDPSRSTWHVRRPVPGPAGRHPSVATPRSPGPPVPCNPSAAHQGCSAVTGQPASRAGGPLGAAIAPPRLPRPAPRPPPPPPPATHARLQSPDNRRPATTAAGTAATTPPSLPPAPLCYAPACCAAPRVEQTGLPPLLRRPPPCPLQRVPNGFGIACTYMKLLNCSICNA